ncbi:MAG TPA: DUF5686 family protein [Prolixibacteraceae bacterium]|nr:DUF5686 family protein [Prolixibacteraceae bacterium]
MSKYIGLIIILLTFSVNIVQAQKTEISGKITEAGNTNPIPYVSILFKGTYTGTMSDLNGNYNLSSTKPASIIEFTAVGFKKQDFTIKPNQVNKLDVKMEEDVVSLAEVSVRPGENPAIPLFRKIVDRKKENNPSNFPSWQSKLYSKTEIDIKNVKESLRKKKLLKQFEFVFKYIDSLEIQGKTFLPIFFTETVSNYYHSSESNSNREEIIANKASGMTSDMITQFTGKMYEGVNPYDNYIMVSDIGLVSPLNSLGLQFYHYYLRDSAIVNGQKIYEISFKPKLPQEPTFRGKFWVEDQSFAVTKVEMQLSEKANINFLNNLQYSIDYQKKEGRWVPRNELLITDLDIQKSKDSERMGFMGRKTNVYQDFIFAEALPVEVKKKDEIVVSKDAVKKDDLFWENTRPIELQKREAGIYEMVELVKTVPLYKTVVEYLYMFYYGYRDLGKVELGPYYYLYSSNKVEGSRLRIGGRTTTKFNPNLRLNGYGAYGFKDEDFKFGGGLEYYFSKKPRSMISLQGQHDYELLGKSSNALMEDNILTSILSKNPNTKLNMIDRVEATFDKEWINGFSNQISVTSAHIFSGPYVPFINSTGDSIPSIRTGEIKLNTRYSPGTSFVQDGFERNTFGNYDPVINLGVTAGLKGFLGCDYDYLKLDFNLSDKIKLNPFGYLTYYLQAGKIWGDVPFPLMKIHEGNETYAFDLYAFNLMNYQEFVSDTYASLFLEHHFQGFFLNKVPLFKRLKWREVVGIRTLIGSYDETKHTGFVFPAGMTGLRSTPYTEFSAGIENIFKIIRVDAVWRYNYNEDRKTKLGIMFSLQLTL